MGDTGSLFVGFVMASIALETQYSAISPMGLLAPLFILAIPIYETLLVSICRIKKGKLPFLASRDHYALRLEKMGFSRKQILVMTYAACIFFSIYAYLFTNLSMIDSILLFISVTVCIWIISVIITSVKVD
jgi:UDP-GlcNAc:undecaprenyl-phosphate GlcNAc-1-phosphate transferase